MRESYQRMIEALQTAKAKMFEQQELIEQLTSTPLSTGVVIATREVDPTPDQLSMPGRKVMIRKDSEYRGQHSGVGTVTENLEDQYEGWVYVVFKDGVKKWYRVGLPHIEEGKCDLRLETPLGYASVLVRGDVVEVMNSPELKVVPGDTVSLSMETMQIVGKAGLPPVGGVALLRRVIDDTFAEVDYESDIRVVYNGGFAGKLERGDRVMLDGSSSIILRNLRKSDDRFRFSVSTNVRWDEIGGLDDAKARLKEAVILPHTKPDMFSYYGKKPVKGILLYGPPGCGKTMLGKATATALASLHDNEKSDGGFFYVKGPEILDRYVGVAEATIRQLFQNARKHKERTGVPAVVFIDEADAILGKRGSGISSDMERTIVPMFLTEMDGLEDSGALIILATNRSDILDPAVVRDGRIDYKLGIQRPSVESATDIFRLNLTGMPMATGNTVTNLSRAGANALFSPSRRMYEITLRDGGVRHFTLSNILNGGMIVSVVQQAASLALNRDIESGKRSGIGKDDIVSAVDSIEAQNRDLNHADAMAEFIVDFKDDVVGINRCVCREE